MSGLISPKRRAGSLPGRAAHFSVPNHPVVCLLCWVAPQCGKLSNREPVRLNHTVLPGASTP
jgi:hypothetical protein